MTFTYNIYLPCCILNEMKFYNWKVSEEKGLPFKDWTILILDIFIRVPILEKENVNASYTKGILGHMKTAYLMRGNYLHQVLLYCRIYNLCNHQNCICMSYNLQHLLRHLKVLKVHKALTKKLFITKNSSLAQLCVNALLQRKNNYTKMSLT